jgi:RNA polymerase sigma factor (sigma-70 family)
VIDAVLSLSEPIRSTIVLRYLEDLPPREVARRLGVPIETVRSRSRRGLEDMRATLGRC